MRNLKASAKNFIFELAPVVIFGAFSYITMHFLPSYISLILALSALIFFWWCYQRDKPHLDLRNVVGSALTGAFPARSAIAIAILFIIYTSWLADLLEPQGWSAELRTQIGSLNTLLYTLTILSFIFSLPFVFAISLHETTPKTSEKREKKKVFIGALSRLGPVRNADEREQMKELYSRIERGLGDPESELKDIKLTWAPLLRAILFHVPVLERVYILISPQSGERKGEFKKILDKYQNKTGSKFEIIFSKEVSFDNYEEIHCELRRIIKEIKRDGYRDEDISIYISGGTSAVTLALTLLAVKEGRQVEYMEQTSVDAKILSINVNIEDLFSLAPELRTREVSGS